MALPSLCDHGGMRTTPRSRYPLIRLPASPTPLHEHPWQKGVPAQRTGIDFGLTLLHGTVSADCIEMVRMEAPLEHQIESGLSTLGRKLVLT